MYIHFVYHTREPNVKQQQRKHPPSATRRQNGHSGGDGACVQAECRVCHRPYRGENPDTVCVELCQSRHQSLRNKEQWRQMDIFKVVKKKQAFLLLMNLLLTAFQKKIAEKFGVIPGQDMVNAL